MEYMTRSLVEYLLRNCFKVTGDAEKLNQEILAFTESAYYYIQNYSINPNWILRLN
jgi:hypothetical protein